MDGIPLQNSIVYGPVESRRLGRSLGINLSPRSNKACSFDCIYCQYGPTQEHTTHYDEENVPDPSEVFTNLRSRLGLSVLDPDVITFSGNGEPTLHPDFPEIVDGVKEIRDEESTADIAVLTNASRVNDEEVRDALNRVDKPILKLDGGTAEKFEEINRPTETDYGEMVEAMKEVERPTLQSLKFRGEDENMGTDLDEWMNVVEEIAPEKVQLYSLDRPAHADLERVEGGELREVGQALEKRGVDVEIIV
ncbi:MAG: radical SAM protein [Halodesulfurarchaeum sp.]